MNVFRYAAIGAVGTLTDLLITVLLVEQKQFSFTSAALAAYTFVSFQNYLSNRIWTFRTRSGLFLFSRKRTVKIAVVFTVGGLITWGLMVLLTSAGLHYVPSKIVTSVIVLLWNFLFAKHWVYKIGRRIIPAETELKQELCIVIPAYNEAGRFEKYLSEVLSYMSEKHPAHEVIVVDDGSSDRTAQIAGDILKKSGHGYVISHQKNSGKGAAVRTGVLASRAKKVLICDADGSTPISELDTLIERMDAGGHQIAIGSRYLKDSRVKVKQPFYRIWIGRLGNFMIRMLVIEGVRDTQCGFKLFDGVSAHDIFSRGKINGWGFDMEVLAISGMLGLKIVEVPVAWQDAPGSRLRPVRDAIRTFCELFVIKMNIVGGRYD